ncbi:hypothetical protein OG775_28850 [Streptomyces platensis]|uniref:hypothetical protein n=1 Tax=Streptomyces platensis TaxID=58346 RepID=UPI002251C4DE|nr:hypothetical protein [Streptomyces platensis]MCX4639083.1 hypothetical protein [Streptomyces platensis]
MAAPASEHLHPLPYLVGEGLRQRGDCGFDPRQIDVAVKVGVLEEKASIAQELADGLPRK